MVSTLLVALVAQAVLPNLALPRNRVYLEARDADAQQALPELAQRLELRGAEVVGREELIAPLRAQTRASEPWKAAQLERAQGLELEKQGDLLGALAALEGARETLARLDAASLDPEGYAAVLAELARCQDALGQPDVADALLRDRALVTTAPLAEQEFSPDLVVRAERASLATPPLPPELPLEWIWQSNRVDRVIAVESRGAASRRVYTLLAYEPDDAAPIRVALAVRSPDPEARARSLDHALAALSPEEQPAPAPVTVVQPQPPTPERVHDGAVISAGVLFPLAYGYARDGVGSSGGGASFGARLPHGPIGGELGGRLDLVLGDFRLEQATLLSRWSLPQGRWTFAAEPGVGLQAREGPERYTADGDKQEPTSVALVLEGAGIASYRLAEAWSVEEAVSVGANLFASNYDLNMPVAFRTACSYRF